MEQPTTPNEMNDTEIDNDTEVGEDTEIDNNTEIGEDTEINEGTEPLEGVDPVEGTVLTEDAPETGARFETPPPPPPFTGNPATGNPATGAPAPANAGPTGYTALPKRLSRTNGPVSGVAGGLGDYFGVDPTLVRIGIVLSTLLAGPVIPIAYIAAWVIIPEDNQAQVAPVMAHQPPPPSDAPAPAQVS